MKYKKHLQAISSDLKEFINTGSYLLDDETGKETITERITRHYNKLIDPKTPKGQLSDIYKVLAGYAILGAINEMDEAIAQSIQKP